MRSIVSAQRVQGALLALWIVPHRENILCRSDVVADRQIKLRRDWDVVLTGDFLFRCRSPVATTHDLRLQKVCRPINRLVQRLNGRGEVLGVETERGSDHCGLGASRKKFGNKNPLTTGQTDHGEKCLAFARRVYFPD